MRYGQTSQGSTLFGQRLQKRQRRQGHHFVHPGEYTMAKTNMATVGHQAETSSTDTIITG